MENETIRRIEEELKDENKSLQEFILKFIIEYKKKKAN